MPQPIRKAVFPVAGLGTRFLPATKAMPKEMLTLVDRPIIQHAVDEARAAGIEQFIFVTSRGKGALEDHFDSNNDLRRVLEDKKKSKELALLATTEMQSGQLMFTRQREPLGLGHAVWCARHLVGNEPFAVLLADMVILSDQPCLRQMMGAYEQRGGNVIAVEPVPADHVNRYGIVDVDNDQAKVMNIRALVEKPALGTAPSHLAITGRYILQPDVFRHLEEKRVGAGGEIQLTDSMARLIGPQPFTAFRFDGRSYDCGDKAGFIEATVAFALQHPELGERVRPALKTLLGQ